MHKGDIEALQISEGTKQNTKRCRFDFQCMTNDNWKPCSIFRELNGSGLLIKNKGDQSSCLYLMTLRETCLCQCPARREIYHRYKI